MFFSSKSKDSVLSELREVDLKIKNLPNNAADFLEAQALIETFKAESASVDQIDAALAEKSFPSVAEVGKVTAECMLDTWKLNRKRRKLERQLSRFSEI